MAKKLKSLRCPICRKIVLKNEAEFPFCSERCRTVDLGRWASGGYVISSPITDPESIEEAGYLESPQRSGSGKNREEEDLGDDFKGSRRPQ